MFFSSVNNQTILILKTKFLIGSSHSQSSRHSKLEKADILEMTVKHLRNLQRVQMTGKLLSHSNVGF